MKWIVICCDGTWDNPQKDFIAPNRLGWATIGLLDSGSNIHGQKLDGLSDEQLPSVWIEKIEELLVFMGQ